MNTKIDISKLYLIDKQWLANLCLFLGTFVAYLGSLHPWFFWVMAEWYILLSLLFFFASVLISNTLPSSTFFDKPNLRAIILFTILSVYISISFDSNLFGFINKLANVPLMYILMSIKPSVFLRIIDRICWCMGFFLLFSAIAFLLYLFGISIPPRPDVFGDGAYSYDNYLLFMVANDREFMNFIPRFSSVFLEPGHLGTATSLLLMTQFGKWKRWYNIVLIIVSAITFSLAAYAFLVALIFLNLWVQRKHIVGKAIIVGALLGGVIGASFVYNDGDNMIQNLILLRLEVDDKTGDIVGNNRVSEDFSNTFDKFFHSSDVVFGSSMQNATAGEGNSGYRVYIYEHGLVGLFLTLIFYLAIFKDFRDWRCLVSVAIISLMNFWVRGYPLWYSNLIPVMALILDERFISNIENRLPGVERL